MKLWFINESGVQSMLYSVYRLLVGVGSISLLFLVGTHKKTIHNLRKFWRTPRSISTVGNILSSRTYQNMRSIESEIRNQDHNWCVHTHTESEIKCTENMGPISSPGCQYQHSSMTQMIWISKYGMLTPQHPSIIGEEVKCIQSDPYYFIFYFF